MPRSVCAPIPWLRMWPKKVPCPLPWSMPATHSHAPYESCGIRYTLYKLCTHLPLMWARCHPSACDCLCQTPSTAADPANHNTSEGCRPHTVVIVYVQVYRRHERLRPLLSLSEVLENACDCLLCPKLTEVIRSMVRFPDNKRYVILYLTRSSS